jgi:3-hydroxyisobutyrate dehydrogenase-like beta-hydroxyacid dehydrogenase
MGQIGFVGTGMMGSPMACNLIKAGFEVLVYDVRIEATKDCLALGARSTGVVSEMSSCGVVFIIVNSGSQVEDVLLGEHGLVKDMKKGQKLTAVIMSTVSPTLVKKLAVITQPMGLTLVDAPVSGGAILAQRGMLSFMIGGEEVVVDSLRPYFQAMGNNVFHVGSLGTGLAVKLVNNIVGITNGYVFTEALKIANTYGLDLKKAVEVINASSGKNWGSEKWDSFVDLVSMVRNDTSFKSTCIKDIQVAINWGDELHLDCPKLRAVLSIAKVGMDVSDELHKKMLSAANKL